MEAFAVHHRMPDGVLVYCTGSREGVPLERFMSPKRKITCCHECGHYNKYQRLCRIDGHTTTANTQRCRQALTPEEARRAY